MGRNLGAILAEQGHMVTVTTRQQRKSLCPNIEYIVGNAHEGSFLRRLLERARYDVVVDFMLYSVQEFSSRIDYMLGSVGQYVFLSSSRVYADTKEPITEKTPRLLDVCSDSAYLDTDEYALAKARQEDRLLESSLGNWTIIRPYITFDDYRFQLGGVEKESWLYRSLCGRRIVFSRDIAQHITTMTSGRDVAEMIAAVIGNEIAKGEIFNTVTNESHRWSEILDTYLSVLRDVQGFNPAVCMTNECPLLTEPGGPIYQIRYDRLYDRIFDNEKIMRMMARDWRPRPVLDMLSRSLKNFLSSPRWASVPFFREAAFDRISGDVRKVGEFDTWKYYMLYLLYRFCGYKTAERLRGFIHPLRRN